MTTIFGNKKRLAVVDNSSSVLVEPVGGLEVNSSNELKIKRDGGIQTTADGTSVIDRVEKAGDIMTGTLTIEPNAFNAIVATPSGGNTTTINWNGLGISSGGSIGVGILPGGPALEIQQRSDSTFSDGIRVRNTAGDQHCQIQWDETGDFVLNRVGAVESNKIITIGESRAQVATPTGSNDIATKGYVDGRKPVITVWAEENGPIRNGQYQWSFGNGATGNNQRGYPIPAAGRILRMGLSASMGGSQPGESVVNIVVNGIENTAYSVIKPNGRFSGTNTFGTPLELAQGDRINFRSDSTNNSVTSAIVSLLIELDL